MAHPNVVLAHSFALKPLALHSMAEELTLLAGVRAASGTSREGASSSWQQQPATPDAHQGHRPVTDWRLYLIQELCDCTLRTAVDGGRVFRHSRSDEAVGEGETLADMAAARAVAGAAAAAEAAAAQVAAAVADAAGASTGEDASPFSLGFPTSRCTDTDASRPPTSHRFSASAASPLVLECDHSLGRQSATPPFSAPRPTTTPALEVGSCTLTASPAASALLDPSTPLAQDDLCGASSTMAALSLAPAAWAAVPRCPLSHLRQPPQQQPLPQQQPDAWALPLDLAPMVAVALGVASGLAYLHSRSIIHADLSCNNVLLATSRALGAPLAAKIADFGLSLRLEEGQAEARNVWGGTAYYRSPEVADTHSATTASDVWALGVVLHELYHGPPPWRARPDFHDPQRRLRACDVLRVAPHCPPPYADLMCRCLSVSPADRPSARACVRALLRMERATAAATAAAALSAAASGAGGAGGGAAGGVRPGSAVVVSGPPLGAVVALARPLTDHDLARQLEDVVAAEADVRAALVASRAAAAAAAAAAAEAIGVAQAAEELAAAVPAAGGRRGALREPPPAVWVL